MGGIEILAEAISADLKGRLPGQRKTQREKLALLVATIFAKTAILVPGGEPVQVSVTEVKGQWTELLGAAGQLSRQCGGVSGEVERFLADVKAA